jgi:hypothetical protein
LRRNADGLVRTLVAAWQTTKREKNHYNRSDYRLSVLTHGSTFVKERDRWNRTKHPERQKYLEQDGKADQSQNQLRD